MWCPDDRGGVGNVCDLFFEDGWPRPVYGNNAGDTMSPKYETEHDGGTKMSAQGTELLEKLGLDMHDVALIIHCDDMGLCHDATVGAYEVIEQGVATSGSIMVPCPWARYACHYAQERPELDIGVHLTLNSEQQEYRWGAVTSRDRAASLLDPEGFLWPDVPELAQHAAPAQVKHELREQVKRAMEFGLRPTHIDTHRGAVCVTRQFLEAYIELSRETSLPILLLQPTEDNVAKHLPLSYGTFYKEMQEFFERSGVPLLDSLIGVPPIQDYETAAAGGCEAIRTLPPGVHQMIVHPMKAADEGKAVVAAWEFRDNDRRFCLDPRTRQTIESAGIKLIGWRDIQQAFHSGRGD